MHIFLATAEVSPFSKESPLGDLCNALPRALRAYQSEDDTLELKGVTSVSVLTPLYGNLDPDAHKLARRLQPLKVKRGRSYDEVIVYEGRTPEGVRTFFFSHEALFGREFVYGPPGEPYKDNAERFSFFARCVVEFAKAAAIPVDVIHCFDWAAGLVPVWLDALYDQDDRLAEVLTVFSVQDVSEQGVFAKSASRKMGLPKAYYSEEGIQHDGKLNFLKGGITFADFVTTRGPSVVEAVQKDAGGGLEELFSDRRDELFGVVGGIDYRSFNPATDPALPVTFHTKALNGKRRNKAELQFIFGLPPRPLVPIVAVVGKPSLADADLVLEAVADVVEDGAQLQLIGMGQTVNGVAETFASFVEKYPRLASAHLDKDEVLERRVLAGADVAVVTRGTNGADDTELVAMRYGTVPIARRHGRLLDTVASVGEDDPSVGVGFQWDDGETLADAIRDAVEAYHKPRQWRPMVERCMHADFSWEAAAGRWFELYLDLLFPPAE